MLALSRKKDEAIVINDDIEITVIEIYRYSRLIRKQRAQLILRIFRGCLKNDIVNKANVIKIFKKPCRGLT